MLKITKIVLKKAIRKVILKSWPLKMIAKNKTLVKLKVLKMILSKIEVIIKINKKRENKIKQLSKKN